MGGSEILARQRERQKSAEAVDDCGHASPVSGKERLSRDARVVLAGSAVSALGNGLTLPFLLIYLHKVRRIPLDRTGLLLAIPGLISLVAGPLTGTLVDKLGARLVLAVGSVGSALAYAGLAEVHTAAQAIPVEVLIGAANSSFYPSQASLFGRLATGRPLRRLFATNFVLINMGIGVGGLIAGLFVDVHRPDTFALVYVMDAATFLGYTVAVSTIHETGRAAPGVHGGGSYREVLKQPLFLHLFTLSLLLALTGYTQIESGLPAFATDVAHVSPRTIALSFVANTTTIVAGQLLVLRRLERIRHTRALLAVAAIWAASWLLLGLGGVLPSHEARVAVVIAFGALFGFGETFLSPTAGPLTNDVAPEHLRGRFNALTSTSYAIGFTIGPAISAGLIGAHLAGGWLGLLMLGLLGVVALSLRLEARLTPAQNGLHPDTEARQARARNPMVP